MIRLAELKASAQVIDDLAWPYDFDLDRVDADRLGFTFSPSMTFHVLAGDGTGGVFLAYGEGSPDHLPVLHATSEGQAGKIAPISGMRWHCISTIRDSRRTGQGFSGRALANCREQ